MEKKIKGYLPRFKRSENKPPLKIQQRDIEILRHVYENRFLTTQQVLFLIPGSSRVILLRLQKLFHNGYLDRLTTDLHKENIYALGNKGADLLVENSDIDRGKIDWAWKNRKNRKPNRNHTLMISNFRIALARALKTSSAKIHAWMPEGEALKDAVIVDYGQKKTRIPFCPDAFFSLSEGSEYLHFFLEADQSTMTNERFLTKMKGYWNFYKQGKHKQKFDINAFRVLTITKSKARAENLRRVAKKADDNQAGSAMFWFASEDNYSLEKFETILQLIWRTPKDETLHHLLE